MGKMYATLFLALFVVSTLAAGDICAKIKADGELINAAVKFSTCSNVLTEEKAWIENWSWIECQKASKNVTDISVFTDENEPEPMYLLAFVAYDHTRSLVVVSFRATTCGMNWENGRTDFQYSNMQYENGDVGGCKALTFCRMHKGFQRTYDWFQPHIRKAVQDLVAKYKSENPKVLVTGISYGAAIAAIASYDLKLYGKYDIISYTFGGPRIGN